MKRQPPPHIATPEAETLYVRVRPPEVLRRLDEAVESLYYPSRAALVSAILRGDQPWPPAKKGEG